VRDMDRYRGNTPHTHAHTASPLCLAFTHSATTAFFPCSSPHPFACPFLRSHSYSQLNRLFLSLIFSRSHTLVMNLALPPTRHHLSLHPSSSLPHHSLYLPLTILSSTTPHLSLFLSLPQILQDHRAQHGSRVSHNRGRRSRRWGGPGKLPLHLPRPRPCPLLLHPGRDTFYGPCTN
jgi:hypothetical protein